MSENSWVPQYATIDTATSGDNTVIAAVTGQKIRILGVALLGVGTAVNVYFKDGAGTAKFGSSSRPIVIDKTGATGPPGFCLPYSPAGWFETAAGQAAILNLSTTQGIVGTVIYSVI